MGIYSIDAMTPVTAPHSCRVTQNAERIISTGPATAKPTDRRFRAASSVGRSLWREDSYSGRIHVWL